MGWQQGIWACSQPFLGTSIIIPTYNQQALLQQCLESIFAHTPEAHEVIVVDNGSTDGTESYVRSLGNRVVYRKLERNTGFAAGINQGLRVARGEYLLLLNNDTVVTECWLSNLLACLLQVPDAGLVGPVTNYISGSQQIETSYGHLDDMHRFAASYNRSDPERWQETDRITGFCVLMKRSVFRKLGYMDEGYEIGNCEDDDFGLRVRLLGLKLIVARDTFIHHVGSASMKTLAERFDEVYGNNLLFFGRKWGDPGYLETRIRNAGQLLPGSADYFPSHVLVKGRGETRYWLENGRRYPVGDGGDLEAVRLSMIDLKSLPAGPPIGRSEVEAKLTAVMQAPGAEEAAAFPEGMILQDEGGRSCQYVNGCLRPFIGEMVMTAWGMENRTVLPVAGEILAGLPEGLPLLPPPVIRSDNI